MDNGHIESDALMQSSEPLPESPTYPLTLREGLRMLYNEQFFLSDGEMQKLALRGKTEPTRPSSVSIVGLPQCPTAAEQERHTRSLQGGERQRILAHIANIIGHHYAAQQLPYRLILTAEDVSGTEHPSHAGSLAKDEEPSYIPQAAAA